MATSSITFYKTAIDPNRNMVIEGMTQYLQTCDSVGPVTIMYVKPAMDVHLNIEWPQRAGWRPTRGTYAAVSTGDQTHYYFITKTDWVAESTVGLELHLDTINSFWIDYRSRFTDRTHITRQHRNRFQSNGARLVDEFDEGITPVLRYVGSGPLGDTSSRWYLVYKTDTEQTNSTVSCYCCANNRILKSAQSAAAEQTLTTADFIQNVWYYLIADDDCLTPGIGVGGSNYAVGSNNVIIIRFRAIGTTGTFQIYTTDDHGNVINSPSANAITFHNTRRVYYDTSVTTPSGYTSQLSNIREMATRTLLSGTVGSLYLEPISKIDRTDPLLIKIVELGYSPFTVQYNSGGEIQVPSGWEYDYLTGMFRLTNLDNEFSNPAIANYSLDNIEYVHPLVVNPQLAPDPFWESKLYNSNFYSLKFGYDAESWTFKPEKLFHFTDVTSIRYLNCTTVK